MKTQLITLFSSFFCSLIFTTSIQAQESIFDKLNAIATVDEKVMMPMRDGVRLASDIYISMLHKTSLELTREL